MLHSVKRGDTVPCTVLLREVSLRAATDSADPDPDLLTTRIQNSRSGSVKKIFLSNLLQKFGHLKICSDFFDKIFSLKAVYLKLFVKKVCPV